MTSSVIRLSDITLAYDRHPAVHHLDGAFPFGSMTAVAGPNGAGKSTLLKALIGELPVTSGAIDLGVVAPTDIGYLPQAAEIDRHFPLTVGETVLLGAWRQAGAFSAVSAKSALEAQRALAAGGLPGCEQRPIGSLSAGQFQRVLFARLLLQDAKVILLDEPFTAVDARTTRDLLALVQTWHREGRTVIAVLHDFEQIRANFPQTLLLARELIAWGPTASALTPANLQRAQAMAEGWDEDAQVCRARAVSAA